MKIDLKKYLIDNNISVIDMGKNTQKGWININCPFCADHDNHGGFHLVSKFYYTCWKCGWHSLDSVFKKILKKSFLEVKVELANYIISTEHNDIIHKKTNTNIIVPGTKKYLNYHKKYLEKRSFDIDFLIEKYDLFFTNHLSDYNYRIIFPIKFKNEIVSFQGRSIIPNHPIRYKACSKEKEIINHKNLLYNLDNCKLNTIIVVEGIFDCLRLGDNSCALFGTGYTENQVKLLSNYKNVYILFDNEKIAQEKAERLGIQLSSLNVSVNIMNIDREDPAVLTEKEVRNIKNILKIY